MSRRGKNNVKRAIVSDATSIFSAPPTNPTPINNFNPLFHYLQTMFPNYDNAVLNSVLEQEGNSIERAIEVLLTFAVPEEPKTSKDAAAGDEICFIDDFSDDDTDETPSNVFAVPVMPPVTSHNSGRDHVSLYEYRKKRKATKSQRARRRQRAHQVQAAAVAAAAAAQNNNNKKKVKWVPLQEFIVETANPFDALTRDEELLAAESLVLGLSEKETEEKLPATVADPEEDETRCLLSAEEIKESWDEFESAQVLGDEPQASVAVDCSFDDFDDFSDFSSSSTNADEWLHYTPPTPQEEEETTSSSASSSSSCSTSEDEDFVVIQEPLPSPQLELEPLSTQSVAIAPVVVTPAAAVSEEKKSSEQVVVVKLYYSSSDIHRLGLARSTFTFAKLFDHAGAYLQSKCQLLAKSALPRAFALTYVDDEGDVIHLCSEEELAEALRLHEQVFWTPGQQPVLRVHVKSLEVAANDGHIVVHA